MPKTNNTNLDQVKTQHYKEKSNELKAAEVRTDLGIQLSSLQAYTSRGKVDLHNLRAVQLVNEAYMAKCQGAGRVPTLMGLCATLGISRQWLNEFLRTSPSEESARYLEIVKESYADLLTQAALRRDYSESVSIFILKNCNSMSDQVRIEAVQQNSPIGDFVDKDELWARIDGSVVDEFEVESED